MIRAFRSGLPTGLRWERWSSTGTCVSTACLVILSLFYSINASGQTLTPHNGPYGGDIHKLHIDPTNGKLYALNRLKLFVLNEVGNKWTYVGDGGTDFWVEGDNMKVSSGGFVLDSEDGGITWTRISSLESFGVHEIEKLPDGQFMFTGNANNNHFMTISMDGGATMKDISSGSATFSLHTTSNGDAYSVTPAGILKYPYPTDPLSLDSWTSDGWINVLPTSELEDASLYITPDGKLHVGMTMSDGSIALKTSVDGAATWQDVATTGLSVHHGLPKWTISPGGRAFIHLFENSSTPEYKLLEYTPAGPSTWTERPWPSASIQTQVVYDIVWRSPINAFAAAQIDGVFSTANGGNSWALWNDGISAINASNFVTLPDSKLLLLPNQQSNEYFYSNNNGVLWQTLPFSTIAKRVVGLPDNTLVMLGGYTNNQFFTSADGLDWQEKPSPGEIKDMVVVAANDIYVFNSNNDVVGTTDKGQTWTPYPVTGLPADYVIEEAFRDDDGYFYLNMYNQVNTAHRRLLRINSSVTPWQGTEITIPIEPFGFLYKIFINNNKLYINTLSSYYVSSDKGAHFLKLDFGDRYAFPIQQGTNRGIGLVSEGNLTVTQDDGRTLRNIATPGVTITQLSNRDGGNTYVGTSQEITAFTYTGEVLLPPTGQPEHIDLNWTDIETTGLPYGGVVERIVVSPAGQLFAISFGNVYRLNAAETAWEKLQPNTITDVFIDDVAIYLIKDKSSIVVSTDNGNTFSETSLLSPNRGIDDIAKMATGELILATGDGVFKCTAQAANYQKIANIQSRAVAVQQSGVIILGEWSNSRFFRSVDNGQTFVEVSTVIANPDAIPGSKFVTAMPDGSFVAAVDKTLMRSTDDGVTWTDISEGIDEIWAFQSIVEGPDGTYYLIFPERKIFVSTNKGTTWSASPIEGIVNYASSIAFKGGLMYVANDGVRTSADGGETLSTFIGNKGITSRFFKELQLIDKTMFMRESIFASPGNTGDINNLYVSHDFGATWSATGFQANGVVAHTGGIMVAYGSQPQSGGPNIWFSSDQGNTWSPRESNVSNLSIVVKEHKSGTYYGWSPGDGGENALYTSTNLLNWTKVAITGLTNPLFVSGLAVDESGNVFILTHSPHALIRVSLGVASVVPGFDRVLGMSHISGRFTLFLQTGVMGELAESEDGVTWAKRAVPALTRFFSHTDPDQFFLTGGGANWVSRNGTNVWQNLGDGSNLPIQRVIVDDYTGIAYAIATGRPLMKSGNISYPDDHTGPTMVETTPENAATNVSARAPISIAFNEAATAVPGKKIRISAVGIPGILAELDVTAGVQFGRTFTFELPPTLLWETQHTIRIDAGAFKDVFGNDSQEIPNLAWTFTTSEQPDVIPPTIVSTTIVNFEAGSTKKFSFTATDNKALAPATATIHYKRMTGGTFVALTLTAVANSNPQLFEIPQAGTWYTDQMGIQLYFEIADASGNKSRSPQEEDKFYYSYITHGAASPALPALPGGGDQSNYRIISVPYELSDNKISTVLSELGDPGSQTWRLLTYGGTEAGWLEYANDFTTFERGKGYWINVMTAQQPAIEGASSPANNPENFFTMQLKSGWNQIGNPYPVDISWTQIRNVNPTLGRINKFAGGQYVFGDVLTAHEGGFVYVNGPDIDVKIPFKDFTARTKSDEFPTDLSSDAWLLPLTLTQGASSTILSGIGMHTEATAGYDWFDDLNPPPFINNPELNVINSIKGPRQLARHITKTEESFTWSLAANTSSDKEASLEWDNSTLGANSKELFLLDEGTQSVINMREVGIYRFLPGKSGPFRIYFGENIEESIKPTRVTVGDPYPNPSTGVTVIPFTLSDSGDQYDVNIEITDVMGRPVSRVMEEKLGPGFHKAIWDASGEQNISGVYIIRLKARSEGMQGVFTSKIVLKK